jgi:two-component system response regulator PilR (NtrC family)
VLQKEPLRVLLVENAHVVRDLLEDVLQDAGFHVTVSERIAEARALLASDAFEMVITDVILPDGLGSALAAEARQMGIRTLLVTGHPAQAQRLEQEGFPFLQKPFRVGIFLERVGAVLAPAAG